MMNNLLALYFTFQLLIATTVLAADAARVEGDLKVNGITFGDSSTLYSSNDLMKNRGNWSPSVLYSAGDVVQSGGSSYVCTTANTNMLPPNTSYWSLLSQASSGLKSRGTWISGSLYYPDDVVQSGGSSYICIATNMNQQPPNSMFWATFAAQGIQGIQGPPGVSGISTVASPPSSSTEPCTAGEARFASGYLYFCYSNNSWVRAPFATWPDDIFNAPLLFNTTLTKGQGLTFSRASAAWVPSPNGSLAKVATGYASFPGMRNVTNQLQYTEDFSNALWVATASGLGSAKKTPNYDTAPDGTTTACRIQLSLGGGTSASDIAQFKQTVSMPGTGFASGDVWMKSLSGTPTIVFTTSGSLETKTLTSSWVRYRVQNNYATHIQISTYLRGTVGTSNSADFLFWHPQLLLTTGYGPADLFAEYVPNLDSTIATNYYQDKYFSYYDNMVTLGDSFTSAGYYQARVMNQLYYTNLVNKGISSQKLAEIWARWNSDVQALAPKSLLIMGGINDIFWAAEDPNSGMRAIIQAMIASCTANNIKPFLSTLPPFGNSANWNPARQAWLESFNAWITSYAASNNIPLVDLYGILRDPGAVTLQAVYDNGDGLHPSYPAGYNAIGDGIIALMEPMTLVPITNGLGILSEPGGTNIFSNSTTPATQSVTVTNVQHVLSFYGTGAIVLSGVSSGTLAGIGENNRVQMAFTPSAGSLTLTLSGSVTSPQLEISPMGVATSPALSANATTIREATVITGVSTTPKAGQPVVISGKVTFLGYTLGSTYHLVSSWVDANNYTSIIFNGSTSVTFRKRIGGINYDAVAAITAPTLGTQYTFKATINADNTTSVSWNGGTASTQANTSAAQMSALWQIGSLNATETLYGQFQDVQIEN